MNVYLTARFARKDEMTTYAADLNRLGHQVTSRWLGVEFDPNTPLSHPNWSQLAQQDIDDIRRADALICFTEPSGGRAARHAEFGIGLGLGKRMYIVELVSEVVPKALTSFVQNDIGCQQRH